MSEMWHITPCKDESKTNQDSLGHEFWIPCFETLSYRFWSLLGFQISELNSGFQSPAFRIPRAKVSGFQNPRRINLYGARHDTNFGSLYVSGKLPTYPSPKPTLTLTCHLRQNVGLRGWGREARKRITQYQVCLVITLYCLTS